MLFYLSDEDYVNLVTSYEFVTQLEFKTRDEVEAAFLFFQEYDRLTPDVQDYLLDQLNKLNELEITECIED